MSQRLKTCWYVVCSLVFFFYLYIATDQYIARLVVTTSKLREKARFPALSLCMDPVQMHCYNISTYTPESYDECENNLFRQSTSEIFRILPSTLSQVDRFYNNGGQLIFKKREFLKSMLKCVQVRFLDVTPNVSFSLISSNYMKLYLNALENYGYPYDNVGINLPNDHRTSVYKFRRIETISLPAPYTTNCFDYRSESLEGPGHCIQHCLLSETSVFHDTFLSLPNDSYVLSSPTQSDYSTTKCSQKCHRPSCYAQTFLVADTDNIEVSFQATINSTYTFVETYPVLITQYIPLFPFDVYLLYICSCFAMCLDICALTITSISFGKLKKMFNNKLESPHYRIHKKAIKYPVIIMLCVGCLWQMVSATNDYLSYSTSAELFIGSPLFIKPPAISICFKIDDIILPAIMSKKRSEKLGDPHLEALSYISINRLTSNRSSLISELRDLDSFSANATWILYFKGDLKCFYAKAAILYLDAPLGVYTWIKIEKRVRRYVYLHAQNHVPMYHYHHSIESSGQTSTMYTYLHTKMLPHPYGNCIESSISQTPSECFERCLKAKIGRILPPNFLLTVAYDDIAQFWLALNSKATNSNNSDYILQCNNNCNYINCDTTEYGFSRVKLPSHNVAFMDDIIVTHPTHIISMKLVIKQNTVEYLLFLISILGNWFGFTFYMLINRLNKFRDDHKDERVHDFDSSLIERIYVNTLNFVSKNKRLYYLIKSLQVCFTTACCYHFYHVCKLYLLREVVTEVTIKLPTEFVIPTFSICFFLCEVYNGSANCDIRYLKSLSALELNSITFSYQQLFQYISALSPDSYIEVETKTTKNTHYYMNELKCFRVRIMHGTIFSMLKTKLFTLEESIASVVISSKNNTARTAFLYFHEDQSLQPYVSHQNSFNMYRALYRHVGFILIKTKLLPYPYPTNCMLYKDSRQNCIESCLQRESRKMFNTSSGKLVRNEHDSWRVNMNLVHLLNLFRNKCTRKICGSNDCITTSYKYIEKLKTPSKHMQISIIAPDTEITTEYVSKLNLVDLSIYLGGILGLWIGLNFISLFDVIRDVIPEIKVFLSSVV